VRPLRDWSRRRVALVALAWLLGVPAAILAAGAAHVAWLVRRQRQAELNAPADSGAHLPAPASDIAIAVSGWVVVLLVLLVIVPPVVLVLARRRARRAGGDAPPPS
jgi:hypothetical protein